MTRATAVLMGVMSLAVTAPAAAITWDFAADQQGWHARDGQCALGTVSCAPLRSVVADGVWRVTPLFAADVAAMVELVSPRLDHRASLSDRLEIRFRVVHPDPFVGQVGLWWEAGPAEEDEGRSWSAQFYAPGTLFTGEWQTVTVGSIGEHQMTTPGAWSGILHALRSGQPGLFAEARP